MWGNTLIKKIGECIVRCQTESRKQDKRGKLRCSQERTSLTILQESLTATISKKSLTPAVKRKRPKRNQPALSRTRFPERAYVLWKTSLNGTASRQSQKKQR